MKLFLARLKHIKPCCATQERNTILTFHEPWELRLCHSIYLLRATMSSIKNCVNIENRCFYQRSFSFSFLQDASSSEWTETRRIGSPGSNQTLQHQFSLSWFKKASSPILPLNLYSSPTGFTGINVLSINMLLVRK